MLRALIALLIAVTPALAQPLDPVFRQKVDSIVQDSLTATGVSSASIAIIQNDKISYQHAYGKARIDPPLAATPGMAYSIGSISKQFTATAILLLAEDGKLSLDDPVSRFIPNLTRANEITIRQLLSHTSGYQDYWPQDYVPPFMLQPTTSERILDLWARKPLDFEPGTDWQYSNTNFVIAGLIVEEASGMPLMEFLSKRVFTPLDMKSVMNIDQNHLPDTDPTGYLRYALGPPRPAPKEGKGWLFAAAELAMPVEDLAKWDIGLMDQKLLKPASYKEMETEVLLKNGVGAHYGLGIMVRDEFGQRALVHDGEVSGFTSENIVFPENHAAVIVFVNQDATPVSSDIARRIAPLLLTAANKEQSEEQALAVFVSLQQGKLDRSLFTQNCNSYFTAQAVKDFSGSLAPLGIPRSFDQTDQTERGGMTFHAFEARFPNKAIIIWERVMPDGKIEQFQISSKL
jgi:D-alanyl-D-alanine carboxypeptidase